MAEGPRYGLGIDIGSSFVAAAVYRGGKTERLPLGERADLLPAVVGWRGRLVAGDAAERLALTQPDAVVRGLKSRVGDPLPLRFGGTTQRVETLLVALLSQVVASARRRCGGLPSSVALTHPAGWGPFRCEALAAAAGAVGLGEARLVTDPVAAASAYFTARPIREGRLVAVYSFGGHAFQATILRRTANGFQVVGKPEGFVDLGGVDLDARVLKFVRQRAKVLDRLDPETPDGTAALAAVRRDCIVAKQQLSREMTTTIVVRPRAEDAVTVPLTRAQFEDLVGRHVTATVDVFGELLDTNGVDPRSLDATLLVGGSSQIPLVSRLLVEKLGVRPVPAGHPKFAVPIGATLVVARTGTSPASEDSTKIVTKGDAARQGELARALKWWRSRES